MVGAGAIRYAQRFAGAAKVDSEQWMRVATKRKLLPEPMVRNVSMNFVRTLSYVLLLALASGCAVGSWTRPNTTKVEYYDDRDRCELQAKARYPVMMVSANFDANAIYRSDAVDACLRAKGYVFKIGG